MRPLLYDASVPVFRDYLGHAALLAEAAGPALLSRARIADGPTADRLIAAAAGLALRGACPLAGRDLPGLPLALAPRLAVARAMLGAMQPADFEGAESRLVRFRLGDTETDWPAVEYLFRVALPRFFFHLATAHAALRAAGLATDVAELAGLMAGPADDGN